MPTGPGGLRNKFRVYDRFGEPVGGCVVLKFDDPLAARALLVWAKDVERVHQSAVLLHDVANAIATNDQETNRPPTGATVT